MSGRKDLINIVSPFSRVLSLQGSAHHLLAEADCLILNISQWLSEKQKKKRELKNETMQEGTGRNALSSIHGRETRIAPKITAWGLKP